MSAIQTEGGQDFDLNLAPIIDCFTVLITYLLVSASFISLTALDVGVAAQGQADPSTAPTTPPYNLMIELTATHALNFKLTGGPRNVNLALPVASAGGQWNLAAIERQAQRLASTYPDLKEATLSSDPSIVYKDVVHIVELLKKFFGKVYISG
jgi:biopolymer transport protein ExbD